MYSFVNNKKQDNTVIFSGPNAFAGVENTLDWNSFTIPTNCSYVSIIAIGGGGSGGRGQSGALATVRAGGGGGGSGGVTTAVFPRTILPDTIYIKPGGGGYRAQISPGIAGSDGIASYVAIYPNTSPTFVLVRANGGTRGGDGTTLAGTAGVGGAAITSSNCVLISLASAFTSVAGGSGSAGGTTGQPTAVTVLTSGPVVTTGGAGGGPATSGNASSPGGSINTGSIIPTLPGYNGSAGGRDGFNGLTFFDPILIACGGVGGGGFSGSTAFNGGDGGMGSGGGGGGGGATGGSGGHGGGGAVILRWW